MNSVSLPLSKSIANRRYILDALEGKPLFVPDDGSDCGDLADMRKCISDLMDTGRCRVKESGTALRFLVALAACGVWGEGKEYEISCGGRLAERPVEPLLEALVRLGMEKPAVSVDAQGTKRIRLVSCRLRGGKIDMDCSLSSQFASALLLVSSRMEKILELSCGEKESPYIAMTRSMLERKETVYEADWSAAAFFYEYTALHGGDIFLKGLVPPEKSLQGDARCSELFARFGVKSEVREGGIAIWRDEKVKHPSILAVDMSETPDLVPALVVTCCLSGVNFCIEGVSALRHKESDRIKALEDCMRSFGYVLESDGEMLLWKGERCIPDTGKVEDHADHRIAMAIEASGLRETRHPQCVEKSFPHFMEEIGKIRE